MGGGAPPPTGFRSGDSMIDRIDPASTAARPIIGRTDPILQSGPGVRVEILPSCIAGYGRKLYVVEQGSRFQIPDGRAHAHGSEDKLIPIAGEIWLAFQTSGNPVQYARLFPGHQYTIPPHTPHQVEIRGGVLESLFPTAVYEQKIPIYELPGGFFTEGDHSDATV